MNKKIYTLFIILAIITSIGGIQLALEFNITPPPYQPPQHVPFTTQPHTIEVLTIQTQTQTQTPIQKTSMTSLS